eukprot:798242-Prymnesium_polylepis.1
MSAHKGQQSTRRERHDAHQSPEFGHKTCAVHCALMCDASDNAYPTHESQVPDEQDNRCALARRSPSKSSAMAQQIARVARLSTPEETAGRVIARTKQSMRTRG